MTPKQVERIRVKIKRLKAALAKDKKYWGGYYHDGQGLRYLIPSLYLQIEDYKGGQRYFNWFDKNFPDDSCNPGFLFQWTVVLYMNGKTREAEKKLFETFQYNTYIIDKFLGKEIIPIEKWEGSILETPGFTEHFHYSSTDKNLQSFSEWLVGFVATEKFLNATGEFIEIEKRLKFEDDRETSGYLRNRQQQLLDDF